MELPLPLSKLLYRETDLEYSNLRQAQFLLANYLRLHSCLSCGRRHSALECLAPGAIDGHHLPLELTCRNTRRRVVVLISPFSQCLLREIAPDADPAGLCTTCGAQRWPAVRGAQGRLLPCPVCLEPPAEQDWVIGEGMRHAGA
jgi:hypothetical protein